MGHANQQLMTSNVPTAPSSPDCPPFPNIDLDNLSLGTTSGKAKVDSEELVGMGLYDSPAEVQSSSLLFGRFSQSGQKSLKLAESFEPVEQDEDADEDDEDAAHEQESESNDSSMTAFPSYWTFIGVCGQQLLQKKQMLKNKRMSLKIFQRNFTIFSCLQMLIQFKINS